MPHCSIGCSLTLAFGAWMAVALAEAALYVQPAGVLVVMAIGNPNGGWWNVDVKDVGMG